MVTGEKRDLSHRRKCAFFEEYHRAYAAGFKPSLGAPPKPHADFSQAMKERRAREGVEGKRYNARKLSWRDQW